MKLLAVYFSISPQTFSRPLDIIQRDTNKTGIIFYILHSFLLSSKIHEFFHIFPFFIRNLLSKENLSKHMYSIDLSTELLI